MAEYAADVAGRIRPDSGARLPLAHAPETVLTLEQVAQWLQLSVRTIEKLPIKSFYIGNRRRFLAQHVLDYIGKAAE